MPGLWYLRGVYVASDSGVGGGRVVAAGVAGGGCVVVE